MGFISQAKEIGKEEILQEKPEQAPKAKETKMQEETSTSPQPKEIKKYIINHEEEQESPLKDKISQSYEKILRTQEEKKQKEQDKQEEEQEEEHHSITHTDTSTIITTIMDKLLDFIKQQKTIGVKQIADTLKLDQELIEYWLKILQKHGYVTITYPLNMFADIKVSYIDKLRETKEEQLPANKELLDEYSVSADHIVARIKIWGTKSKDIPLYQIIIPQIGEGTQVLMDEIIHKIPQEFDVELEELTDKKKKRAMIERFFGYMKNLLKNKLPNITEEFIDVLSGTILHKMYGLAQMEIIMADNWIEEIALNGSQVPVSVYHKRFGWVKTTIRFKTEEEIYNFASRIGRNVGREINSLNPIMDAHLGTGDRVAATLFPISSAGNTITIRRFSRNPWSIVSLIDPKFNTMSTEVGALLWLAMQYELNIIVAGGTASGKTSVLNGITSLIPPKQRIISIEDTREIFLPKDLHWNWVPMTTRNANPEGKGEISMLDLMVASLRMRPDRIIVGEVRRKEQAEAMFETMHTGHSVYATMHADTVEQVERRLMEPPIAIPKAELGALHLIIVQYRDRRRGVRRTLELAEVLSAEGEENSIELNYLYRWRPRSDTFEKINESIRLMQELNLHTGMTAEEIKKDLKGKETILNWLSKHDIKEVDKVGKITKIYYATPEPILEAAKADKDPRSFF